MSTEQKAAPPAVPETDRIEMTLTELLAMETLLWTKIRGEVEFDKLNYSLLRLMGKLHKSSMRLREKINQAGGR